MADGYEHSNKRQRTDNGSRDTEVDRFKPPPSCCVHVRGLSETAIEGDLVEAVNSWGHVKDIMMMPRKKQALIEFEDLAGATSCVDFSTVNSIYVAGKPAFFNYSTSQKIQRPGEQDETKPPNNVLLFTVLNPQYPITVDVLQKINGPYGQVQRIVIFKKNGVQAMVEFDNIESAKRARSYLNGADIYSGCCTLKIEYAKPTKLNVIRNDQDTWDYTKDLGAGKEGRPGQPLLQEPGGPRFGQAPAPYNGPTAGGGYGGGFGGPGGYYDDGTGGYGDPYGRGGGFGGPGDRFGAKNDRFNRASYEGRTGVVAMVYGLNMDKMNCDRLFNLFCLYGNVVKVKFLKSKEGSAMIELGDPISVERALANLNNVFFFGNKLQLSISNQPYLQDVNAPHELGDGTCSFKSFLDNRNNRFTNPESAQKNRIQSPSNVLHFFNAPPGISELEINELFQSACGKIPIKMKQFPSKTERSCTGLVEFESKSDGMEALVMANHTPIAIPGGKSPFIFKLCFSSMPFGGQQGGQYQ